MTRRIGAVVMALAALAGAAALAQMNQEKGGGDETGPYDLVANWPENYCGAGHQIGSTAGIWAESPDRVYIFNRGCLPVLMGRGESRCDARGSEPQRGWDLGAGGDVTFYGVPEILKPFHGERPVSFHLFFRIRPPAPMGRMHDMTMTKGMH